MQKSLKKCRLNFSFKIGYVCKLPRGGAGPFFSSKSIHENTGKFMYCLKHSRKIDIFMSAFGSIKSVLHKQRK